MTMKIKIKEGDPILVKNNRLFLRDPFGWTTEIFKEIKNGMVVTSMKHWSYCIPFRKFNPRDMEETVKHIYKVSNGQLVNVKL